MWSSLSYNNLYAFIGQQETSGKITQVYARCFNRDALYLREGTCAQGMLDLSVISYIPSSILLFCAWLQGNYGVKIHNEVYGAI